MSYHRRTRLERDVEKLLRATGRPWAIVEGGTHQIVKLDGRQIGVISRSNRCRNTKMIAKAIAIAMAATHPPAWSKDQVEAIGKVLNHD